jgi:hypothetical protein
MTTKLSWFSGRWFKPLPRRLATATSKRGANWKADRMSDAAGGMGGIVVAILLLYT